MSDMKDKTAIVTGGGSGIGKATALRLARAGARVMVGDQDLRSAELAASEIHAAGSVAFAGQVDVADLASVEKFFAGALDRFGRLDIGINNAGIAGQVASILEMDLENFDRVIAIDLRGVWLCMREEAKLFKAQGTGGVMVNTASTLGLVGGAGSGAYSAAKHGVVGLTKAVAIELAPLGIRVNAVCPGIIATNIMRSSNYPQSVFEDAAAKHPISRMGKAEEVAEAMYWLASDASSFVTGTTVAVDGGWTAQ